MKTVPVLHTRTGSLHNRSDAGPKYQYPVRVLLRSKPQNKCHASYLQCKWGSFACHLLCQSYGVSPNRRPQDVSAGFRRSICAADRRSDNEDGGDSCGSGHRDCRTAGDAQRMSAGGREVLLASTSRDEPATGLHRLCGSPGPIRRRFPSQTGLNVRPASSTRLRISRQSFWSSTPGPCLGAQFKRASLVTSTVVLQSVDRTSRIRTFDGETGT